MNKKYTLTILMLAMALNTVFAQTSTKKLSYQAVVRNAANELVVNQNLAVEITILNAENAPQYKETHPSVPTNQNGLLWLWVGEGNPTLGTMADVVWKDAVIRSVFTLPDGSTVTQNTPVTAMPHAFFADEVDTVFLQNYLDTHDVVPDNYVTHPQLNDTLDHYYTKGNVDNILNDYEKKSELCGDVKECIKDTLGKYTTTNQIDTLLGAYFDSTQVKSAIHDTADAIRAAIPATQVNADWNATGGPAEILNKPDLSVYATTNALKDSLTRYVDNDKLTDTLDSYYTKNNVDNILNDYEKKSELCGDVKECIKDTLGKYTTSNEIDTLLGAYFDSTKVKSVISDTATALRAMMGDAANDGIITIDVSGGTIENPTFSVNQANNQTVKITIPETIPAEDGQLTIIAAGDTTRFTANQATNDTVRLNKFATKDTLAAYYDTTHTKDVISDTATALRAMMVDAANDGQLTIIAAGDTTRFTANQATNDTVRLNKFATKDTLAAYYDTTHTKDVISDTATALRTMMVDAANDGQLTIIAAGDTTRFTANQATNDTMRLNKFATKDTLAAYYDTADVKQMLKPYLKANELCDSIVKCDVIKDMRDSLDNAFDTLKYYYTSKKINDTLKAYYDTTLVQALVHDSLTQNVELTIKSDSLFLKSGGDIDTVKLPAVPEQVKSDWKVTNTSSAAYILNKPVIKDSVNIVVKDSLRAANSTINKAIDTIALNVVKDTLKAYYDTTRVKALVHDSIGNGKITIKKNGATITDGSFNLNQKTDQTINITVPTQTSELTNNSNLAYTTGNTFSGTHDFTATTITVPSNEDAIKRPVPTTTPAPECNNMNAVNVCDLLAVFDSLTNKMNDILKTIDTLKKVNDSLAKEIESLKPSLTVTGPSDEQYLCGGSNTITFTASVTNANAGDYTYSWTVNGSVQSSTDTTMYYTPDATGEYKVICTATRSGHATLKDSTSVNVSEGGYMPKFGICVEGHTVTVKITDNNLMTSVIWGDGTKSDIVTAGDSHEYANGNYTIIASSTAFGNCKLSWPISINETTPSPCTVTIPHTNASIYTNTTGGLETVVDGKVVSVRDQEGNTYYVTQIGNQCWMRSNLRTSKYNDGTTIPGGENCSSYSTTDPYHYINSSYDPSYGYFYNWPAASHKNSYDRLNLCPKGWHVPSQEEWATMFSEAGVTTQKNTGTGAVYLAGGCGWENVTQGASSVTPNSYENQKRDKWGFTALPAGRCWLNNTTDLTFEEYGRGSYFWSSTEANAEHAYDWYLGAGYPGAENEGLEKLHGRVVRCLRDSDGSDAPFLSLTASPDDESVLICSSYPPSISEVHTVTYTATIENDNVENYTFEWIAGGNVEEETGTTLTRSWGEGTHMVVCVATKGNVVLKDTVTVSVTVGIVPDIEVVNTSTALTVRMDYEPIEVDSVSWGDNTGEKVPKNLGNVYHTYQTGGDYTITAYSSVGCTSDTTVTLIDCASEFICGSCKVNDADGHSYSTVTIAGQCWMAENLRSESYDGTTNTTIEGKYCPGGNSSNVDTYGYLYTWSAVMNGASSSSSTPSGIRGVCPEGWHVPSSSEITALTSASVGDTLPGKYNGSTSPPYSGFGETASYWSSTEDDNEYAWGYAKVSPNGNNQPLNAKKTDALSVRCVKNADGGGTASVPEVTTGTYTVLSANAATLTGTVDANGNTIIEQGFKWKKTAAGDENYKTVLVSGDNMNYTLSRLSTATEYSYFAFVTTDNGTFEGETKGFTTNTSDFTCGTSSVFYDNVSYQTVQIGSQCWLKNNLRNTHYADNTSIEDVSGAAFYDYTTSEISPENRGLLYNWTAVMHNQESSNSEDVQGICPTGWHVPSMEEWKELFAADYRCTDNPKSIAKALAATTDWETINCGGACAPCYESSENDSSKFSAFPAGYYSNGNYYNAHRFADFWTSTAIDEDYSVYFEILHYDDNCYFYNDDIEYGMSVRCLRDDDISLPSASLSLSPDIANPSICNNNPVSVVITATVTEGGSTANDYDYSWEIPSEVHASSCSGSPITLTFSTTGSYRIVCTAVKGEVLLKKHYNVKVVDRTPVFTICVNDNTLDVNITSQSNVISFSWGGDVSESDEDGCTYAHNGVYTITAMGNACSTSQTIAVGNVTLHPCTLSSTHSYTGHGHEAEILDDNGNIISLKDYDNNDYPVVQIGNQCWMKTNLRTRHYSDGGFVEYGMETHNYPSAEIYLHETPYCIDPANIDFTQYNINTYGLYYNGVAVMHGDTCSEAKPAGEYVQGICPTGWHVPSESDWQDMVDFLTDPEHVIVNGNDAVYEMTGKLAGGCDWEEDLDEDQEWLTPGNYYLLRRNISDFSALPSGVWDRDTWEMDPIETTAFWSSTYYDDPYNLGSNTNEILFYSRNLTFELEYDDYRVDFEPYYRYNNALPVRCVRDAETGN